MKRDVFAFACALYATSLCASPRTIEISLHDAETRSIESSWRLKAARVDVESAQAQESAGFAGLLPRLSIQAGYTFLSTLPEISFGNTPTIVFGDHNNYNVGGVLNYTLWDTFSAINNYRALGKVRESREQDRSNTQVQLLFSVRAAYVRLQLALEELRLVSASLELSQAQYRDIKHRFQEGAGTKLDTVISKRHVLGYTLQSEQKKTDLVLALRDLLSLMGDDEQNDISFEGLDLKLDPLSTTLATWSQRFVSEPPDEEQPQLKSLELLRSSFELNAESLKGKLFPTVQLNMSTALVYPNGPQLVNINQNTIGLSLSLPLYVGDPTWSLIDQKRREARATHYRSRQLKTDLNRDFEKARQLLADLTKQRALAKQDVADSSEVATLYYRSYKEGHGNLTDVQSANNAALQSKVALARIDGQILNQYILLTALAGKEGSNG